MKSEIFFEAIKQRNKLQFVYGLRTITIEPYYLTITKDGKKVVYGRVNNSPEIRMFEYDKIANIKILRHTKFSPLIPIYYSMN
jgi:hypothetical protein